MNILGISGLYHDSAAALVINGEIVAAAQEERFSRRKHDAGIPFRAMKWCLKEGGVSASDLDYVVFYDNPMLTLDRYLSNIAAVSEDCKDLIEGGFETLFSSRMWVRTLIFRALGLKEDAKPRFCVTKHHIAHAASAFFPSPYSESIILTVDGVGEWTTLSIGVGKDNHIEIKEEIRYPHSLGLLYSAFTYFCGFKVNSGDYKFMGLAPYGTPIYVDVIKDKIINIKDDGSFELNLEYFDYQNGRTMVNEKKMSALFGGGKRKPESRITKREMDIAASVQQITEEIILKIALYAKEKYGEHIDSLVMAGGVALNCVVNGKLLKSGLFQHLWIQPAAGDAGGALGAALYMYYEKIGAERKSDEIHDFQKGSYLGPDYSKEETIEFCGKNGYVFHISENPSREIANLLADGKVVGLFTGKMEFGPRALGHRSIIADPRSPQMQSKLNMKIKFRESFRPFAPAVLKEHVREYFDIRSDSPYMLLCADVAKEHQLPFDLSLYMSNSGGDMLPVVNEKRSDIPAVTHVDYSARIQTVDGIYNEDFYSILKAFYQKTGCPVLVNTSFNVRGEPIVCSLMDAYKCFMRTEMDILMMNGILLIKEEQPMFVEDKDWREEYELD